MIEVIGQEKLKKSILEWINTTDDEDGESGFPHFTVIIDNKGTGKTTITKWIAEQLNATYTECDCKVDTVREVIENAYKVKEPVVYHFRDADNMRNEAKNALLKITEEPPENAYIVITTVSDMALPDTLMSRALETGMDKYSRADLIIYAQKILHNYDDINDYLDVSSNPHELEMAIKCGQPFLDYVRLVLDNIAVVESANAFKSAEKLAFKDESDKYDVLIFMRAIEREVLNRFYSMDDIEDDMVHKYAHVLGTTEKTRLKMSHTSANKSQLYDMWVLDMRKVLNDEID